MASARAAWVAALRSGKYKQTKHVLKSLNGVPSYCCLGVACEVAIEAGLDLEHGEIVKEGIAKPVVGVYGEEGDSESLPQEVMEWLGMNVSDGGFNMETERWHGVIRDLDLGEVNSQRVNKTLASLNDRGATFAQIADIIESMPADMFKEE